MNTKFLILFLFAFLPVVLAQNLMTNPGFEQNMHGWDELWTRTANAGRTEIVTSPVHSGAHALHLEHWDSEDWSFRQSTLFHVTPGEIYEYSAWARAKEIGDWVELSVILYDANNSVIDWSYSPNYLWSTENFEYFSSQFIIPHNAAFLTARIVGGGDTDIYIDDMSLTLQGTVDPDQQYVLENAHVRFEIQVPSLAMHVSLKNSADAWDFQPTNHAYFNNVSLQENTLKLSGTILAENLDFDLHISLFDHSLSFQVQADSQASLGESLNFPGPCESHIGDYLVIPRATGMLLPVTEEYPFWEFGLYDWKATMAFVGVTNLESGYMLYTPDPWNSRFRFLKPANSSYSTFQYVLEPSKGEFNYNRTFYLSFFADGGYVEMANTYRQFAENQGYVKTFAEKAMDNANMLKLEGAVDFWALQGEFRRPAFIDSLYHFGMDKAVISLGGGWYNDHSLSGIIDQINDLNLLSSRYDIYTDVWPNEHPEMPWYRTEGYPDDVIVNSDGSLRTGWLSYLEDGTPFQGYYTCSATHADYAREWIADELVYNSYNCRFIDVELSSTLVECYSPEHPTSRHTDALHRVELLDVVKNEFNLVAGSEEARDFAFPVVDFGEGTMSIQPAINAGYDWATPSDDPGDAFIDYNMNPARRIPLHGLVYHDVHVPTWYTGDGLSKVPDYWPDKELFNILYASMPLIMPPSQRYWSQNRERFVTSMNLISAVTRNCGFSKMTNHKFLTADKNVQKTEFENDWKIIVNFSDKSHSVENITLPAKGFWATDGKQNVYRIFENAHITAAAELDDRIFVQPHSAETTVKGIRTDGCVLVLKNEEFIKLAFIGDQTFVDIHPKKIPWPLENVVVKDFATDKPIDVQILSDGFFRLPADGQRFFKLTGNFSKVINAEHPFEFSLSQNYPNPFNPKTTIQYSLATSENVKIHIYNALGQHVRTLLDTAQPAGNFRLDWDGCNENGMPAGSGIYWLVLSAGSWQDSKKLVLMR